MTDILVNDWKYQKNWLYVVLSRVKVIDGLYIREALDEDLSKYEVAPELIEMLNRFCNERCVGELTDFQYESLCRG